MMSACFPEFESINHATVCQWMFELEAKLRTQEPEEKNTSIIDISLPEIVAKPKTRYIYGTYVSKMLANRLLLVLRSHSSSESQENPKRVHKVSEVSDSGSTDSSCCDFSEEVDVLQEMFPHVCSIEVCRNLSNGHKVIKQLTVRMKPIKHQFNKRYIFKDVRIIILDKNKDITRL